MEEILQTIMDNIYEIMVGLGLLLTTIFNKNKTPEQLKKHNEKEIKKCDLKEQKLLNQLKENAKKKDTLQGVKNEN